MKHYLSIIVLVFIIDQTLSNVPKDDLHDDYIDYNENIYRKYVKMDKQLKQFAEQSVKRLLPYLLEAGEHVNISSSCSKNLFELITGFRKLTNWSFDFLDAIGKLQSGIKTGNVQMFGEYGECVETRVMKRGKVDFQGKYCATLCKPYLPKVKKIPGLYSRLEGLVNATRNASDITKLLVSRAQGFYAFNVIIGLCVPSGCSKKDVSEIINYSIGEYINCVVSHCLKDGDLYFWDTRRIIYVSIFVLFGVIVILSTWFDYTLDSWKTNKLGFKSRIFQCFSLLKNFPKLMNTDISENSIGCFNGIRVLTIFWIILGHEYFFHAITLTANHLAENLQKTLPNFFSQIALNGFMSVDVFFFISGFLNCYSRMLIKQEGRNQPSILKIIIHRLWRIYPGYFFAFIFMYLINQPQPLSYPMTKHQVSLCEQYWWSNFLFINNFFDPEKMCFAQSWFLCVDMQLFLLTLFTIPFLLRKPTQGTILHIGIIVIVNLCSMTWWFLDSISPATLDSTRLDTSETMKGYTIYILAPVHVGPYCIGILLGYIIATKKNIKIPKVTQLFGWPIASLFFISMLFMTQRWNSGIPYTVLEGALYGAWSRTILVLGFSWLVFCCATGHAGLINYILSLKLWIPLSRITYMLYLISALIQFHYISHSSFPSDFANINIIWTYFANVSISILMSFVLVLIIESPLISMEKVLFRRNKEENKASSEVPKQLTTSDMKGNGFHDNGKIATIHL